MNIVNTIACSVKEGDLDHGAASTSDLFPRCESHEDPHCRLRWHGGSRSGSRTRLAHVKECLGWWWGNTRWRTRWGNTRWSRSWCTRWVDRLHVQAMNDALDGLFDGIAEDIHDGCAFLGLGLSHVLARHACAHLLGDLQKAGCAFALSFLGLLLHPRWFC